jgi:hypothetical protein
MSKSLIADLKLQRDAIVDLKEEGELAGNTLMSLASGEYKAGSLEMTACIGNHDTAPEPLHQPSTALS